MEKDQGSTEYDQQSRESKLSQAYCVFQAILARFGSSTYDGYKYRVMAACQAQLIKSHLCKFQYVVPFTDPIISPW
jgi:hypothetical protein